MHYSGGGLSILILHSVRQAGMLRVASFCLQIALDHSDGARLAGQDEVVIDVVFWDKTGLHDRCSGVRRLERGT